MQKAPAVSVTDERSLASSPISAPARTAKSIEPQVALLTGGGDKPYALGMASALLAQGIVMDFIGSDDLSSPELCANKQVNFLNLRGDQSTRVSRFQKYMRVARYYQRLIFYVATARPNVLHLLWNNKFEFFDRTVLMFYYRLLGKRIVFTAHNVNAGKRDGNDSAANRFSLKVQYRLSDHIFVHTGLMKDELRKEFGVAESKITVIPFGLNDTLPKTALTREEAREKLGLKKQQKAMLFFGNIAPYKGLEYAIECLSEMTKRDGQYRLIIAGQVKGCDEYWAKIQETISRLRVAGSLIQKIGYIPDEGVEMYFKAADVLVLPYNHIFQSGVLFLAYSFGLPVIATDVGSLREDIVEGRTGFMCQPRDSRALALAAETYFSSDLFKNLAERRGDIRGYADEHYSWNTVGKMTTQVYAGLRGA